MSHRGFVWALYLETTPAFIRFELVSNKPPKKQRKPPHEWRARRDHVRVERVGPAATQKYVGRVGTRAGMSEHQRCQEVKFRESISFLERVLSDTSKNREKTKPLKDLPEEGTMATTARWGMSSVDEGHTPR